VPPKCPPRNLQLEQRKGDDAADIGIIGSMPSPGLCRVWRSSSSTIPIWRFFPHFSNKLNSA
jgi:hypothetical protein